VLNGVPLGEDYHKLDFLNPWSIESIKVEKNMSAGLIYGGKYIAGVITVTTKTTSDNQQHMTKESDTNVSVIKAYKIAREFYVPKYDKKDIEKMDIESTLYWNPDLLIDESGSAKVTFYNNSVPAKIEGIVEGIGYKGKIGSAKIELFSK